MQSRVGGKAEWVGSDKDKMLILADAKRSNRQPMPVLKRAVVAAATFKAQRIAARGTKHVRKTTR